MDFPTAIVLYIILLCVLLTATWRMGIRLFSALTVSALVSAVFLMILVPPSDLDKYTNEIIDGHARKHYNDKAVALFSIIYLATLVLVLWYVLECAYLDHNPNAFADCW
jgi:nitrate/nitrite transporter NarK